MANRVGWQCPGCGRCYSPSWYMCVHCAKAVGKALAARPGTNYVSHCTICGEATEVGKLHECKGARLGPDGIG